MAWLRQDRGARLLGRWAGTVWIAAVVVGQKREPLRTLGSGQRKGIQNQRVTLVEGPADEVAAIRRIFDEFVERGDSEYKIAEGLNHYAVASPGGARWAAGSVLARLRDEKYVGTMVYNHRRIHSALDYQTPAAYAAACVPPASAPPQPPEHSRIT